MLNMASMVLGRSMVSGQPGLSGLTAPEPVEEGSCTESAPVPAQGVTYTRACIHMIFYHSNSSPPF